jgi:hypothetical protein
MKWFGKVGLAALIGNKQFCRPGTQRAPRAEDE